MYCCLSKVKRKEGSCIFFILVIYHNQHFAVPICRFCVILTLATSGNKRVKTEFETNLHLQGFEQKLGAMGCLGTGRAHPLHNHSKLYLHLEILHVSDVIISPRFGT